MPGVSEQVIEFYAALFERIFVEGGEVDRLDRLRARAVRRQMEEAADAASQTLTRFFAHQQFADEEAPAALATFGRLTEPVTLARVADANANAESLSEELLEGVEGGVLPAEGEKAAIYRLGLQTLVRDLMLVGQVVAQWQRLSYSTEFELPRRVVARLNETSRSMESLRGADFAAADERFELSYRDYLLQRFNWVEAGTVRMTTNLRMDLRELFVPPYVIPIPPRVSEDSDTQAFLPLDEARKAFGQARGEQKDRVPALEQVRRATRNVLIGVPGSGKSTFLEWLQVQLASGEEVLHLGGEQAIPILLRVRQLNARNLPRGAVIVEAATASKDRARLMPPEWVHRQMEQGRVLFILDGLDEIEPGERDGYLFPWLSDLCERYPSCAYLVSSRPVGYPESALQKLSFVETQLANFDDSQVREYAQHWCAAVRLARNEAEEEARREGEKEGNEIVRSFEGTPHIRDLARTPLMLSAICLVNYFEHGELPKDRALLYRLCVEGLLHNWDQRRGIRSEFTLDDKLRACREVAIAMQADDRAEYEAGKVEEIFEQALQDSTRAKKLLDHIRFRTGLLVERRPHVFAFAHLTFQEYLAACAIYEGNLQGADPPRLVHEHASSRWHEVIPLYCGSAPGPMCRGILEMLLGEPNTEGIGRLLEDSFVAAPRVVTDDKAFRLRVLERICRSPAARPTLEPFPEQEVAPLANRWCGAVPNLRTVSSAYVWLEEHRNSTDTKQLFARLQNWPKLSPWQLGELHALIHIHGDEETLLSMSSMTELYRAEGPDRFYMTQADVALEVLCRFEDKPGPGRTRALIAALGAAQFSSIPSYDPPKSAPLSQSDRRLLLEAIAIAIKRNPPEYWCRFFTQWSEKLQTQAAISES